MWLIVRLLLMKAGWWDAPLTFRGLVETISITRSKISYNFLEPQPLLCTPACGYEFHALVVHPHPHIRSASSHIHIWKPAGSLWWSFFAETVYVLRPWAVRRGAPSLMFVGILNVTLFEEKVTTTGVTQRTLKLFLRPNSPDSHQTQIQEDEILDWPHVLISLNSSTR